LTIILAGVGFITSLHQRRELKIPRIYLGYFALAGLIQLICFIRWPGNYQSIFWTAELLHNALVFSMSLEIGVVLLPRSYFKLFAAFALAILLLKLFTRLPSTSTTLLLEMSASTSLMCGLLLSLLFFTRVQWTREHTMVTAGVMILILTSLSQAFGAGIELNLILGRIEPFLVIGLLTAAGSSRESTAMEPS
jgi:hypothetical protein